MIMSNQIRKTKMLMLLFTVMMLIPLVSSADEIYLNDYGEYFSYFIEDDSVTLLKYGILDSMDTPEEVCIPAILDGRPLRNIAANAFNCHILNEGKPPYDANKAKRLILPEGLVSLDPYALNGADGFKEIVLPSSLVNVQEESLSDAKAVFLVSSSNPRYTAFNGFLIDKQENALIYAAPVSTGFSLPDVKAFKELSLQNYQPKQIVFPESTEYIGSYTCYDNTETRSVIIPGSVSTIADNAFYATVIEEIILEDGIRYIGAYAFYDTEINELTIPQSIEWLGFKFCQSDVKVLVACSNNCHWETEEEFQARMDE